MVNLLWLDKNNQYNVKREKGNILPKDKSNTTAKITRYLTEEFLTYGYEKASLNRVSAKVGITTAGLYKHFAGKEDMFYSLVKKTLDDFNNMTSWAGDRMNTETDYDPFDDDWTAQWVDFIYSHYVGMKLLICCSTGSKFESFEDDLIQSDKVMVGWIMNKTYLLFDSDTYVGVFGAGTLADFTSCTSVSKIVIE